MVQTSVKNIYRDVRPLLIVCKIFGKTSLKNVFFGKIQFEWGVDCLWPLVFLGTQIMILFLNAQTTNQQTLWFWFTDNSLRESCNYLTTLYSDLQSPSILANIYRFDMTHGRPLKYCRSTRYFMVAYVTLTLGLLSFIILDICASGFSFENVGETINRYSTSIFPLMYLFFCDEICKRFQSLRRRWQYEITKIIEIEPKMLSSHNVEFERLAHAKLCDIVNDICIAFGPRIIIYLFFVFFDHLHRFYFHIFVRPAFLASHPHISSNFLKELEPYLFLAHTWTGTYLIANMSDSLTKSSKLIITDLRKVQLWKLSKSSSEQIKFFMSQVHKSITRVTASGLFLVNRTLLTSIVMSLATYTIVVIQISPILNRTFIPKT